MAGGGLIRRRRSLALDDAAAAELRRITAGGEGEFETPGDTPDPETPLDGDAGNPLNVDADTGSERQKAAEGVGSKLAAKFAAKGLAAKGKKKKEPEPVGPSGQTYTPLEKQFMEIKGKHPDVLLLMEVGYKYK
jgi:DNA mismatch repair protein MSH3